MSAKNHLLARAKEIRALLRKHKTNAFVLTNYLDQFYLTRFYFYAGESVFVIHPKGIACFTRSLYEGPFSKFAPEIDVFACDTDRLGAALDYIKKQGIKSVGFDSAKESYLDGMRMRRAGLVELPSLVSNLRETKDADEIKILRAANRIAYLAYEHVRPLVKTGIRECEVAAELEKFMRTMGATTTSFLTIVAFGENTANPHHETGDRKLGKNEAVLMDFGCIYKGYCSDITRCWWHGPQEPAEYKKIWNIVDKARRAGIKAVRIGTTGAEVDAVSRGIITKAGYGPYFTHRTGHGVGLEVHENPCNSADCKARLQQGNIVTVEPGIYLTGKFGVRLEDTVCVTQKNAAILTKK